MGKNARSDAMQVRNKSGRFLLPIALILFIVASSSRVPKRQDLIAVQIPASASIHRSGAEAVEFSPMDRLVAGSRVVLLSGGKAVNLTADFWGACDPNVSFDGGSILFSGKRREADSWQIWRMKVDGSNKEQVTTDAGDHIAPVHAGVRFYLNDPEPTLQIVYAATTHGWRNRLNGQPTFSLYATDAEGETVRQLTFNLHNDFDPDVLPTGRIVYTSTQKFGDRLSGASRFALTAVSVDGTDFMPFYGNHESPWYKGMAHISGTGDDVYFIESDRPGWLGSGQVASVSKRRPLHSYEAITADTRGAYLSPSVLPDGSLLAAFRADEENSVFTLVELDRESGKQRDRYFLDKAWHTFDIQPLVSRPQPKGKSNWLVPGRTTGVFYCLASHRTNLVHLDPAAAGEIKFVRVIEGVPHRSKLPVTDQQELFGARRLLGIAPVAADGSFHVRVPSDIPVTFQLLDENYMALRSQKAWTWVMGNENRGCIGCHEDRELSPPNRMVDAIIEPPVDLTLPPERRRTVDFRHQIGPIFASSCLSSGCHETGEASPDLSMLTSIDTRDVFERMVGEIEGRENERYVVPGKAKESPLVWLLFGNRLGSEQSTYAGDIGGMPSHDVLSRRERIQVVEWIDLGAQWDSRTPSLGYPGSVTIGEQNHDER